MEMKPKSVINASSLSQFKNEILILLNNITIRSFGQTLIDYLKLVNFILKRRVGALILELFSEDKRNERERLAQ